MTLETILQRIGAYVDQDADTPTSTDLTIRTVYVNEGLEKYAETADWDHLKVTYAPLITQASQATISLPANYRKMASPIYEYNQTPPYEFDMVDSADWREKSAFGSIQEWSAAEPRPPGFFLPVSVASGTVL